MGFYLFIISLFFFGAAFALGGVALGGWLVYRTKRDPYDPLFSRQGKGEVFTLDDGLSMGDESPATATLPKATEQANEAFIRQFADKIAAKVG